MLSRLFLPGVLPRARFSSEAFKQFQQLGPVREPLVIFCEGNPFNFKIGINALSVGLALFWANATYLYWPRDQPAVSQKQGRPNWFERLMRSRIMPVITATLGLVSFIGGAVYPLRVVRMLRLLPGDRVELATFSYFGLASKPRVEMLPLARVSAINSRASARSTVQFTVQGRGFPYSVDVTKGQFPNPLHFDFLFAVKR